MVKWYNITLPMLSRGFDYPWPHKIEKDQTIVWSFSIFEWVIEKLCYSFEKRVTKCTELLKFRLPLAVH